MREMEFPTTERLTSELVPELHLMHGRAVWVLQTLGLAAGVPPATFNHYIKSLRKVGVPFARGEFATIGQQTARYSYNHLVELSLALTLRVYGVLPDPVLTGLITYRRHLYDLYRRAYLEYATGLGSAVSVNAKDQTGFEMSGVYLDLRIQYASGRLLEFGPPRLLSPSRRCVLTQ